jgi:hypothetical protein
MREIRPSGGVEAAAEFSWRWRWTPIMNGMDNSEAGGDCQITMAKQAAPASDDRGPPWRHRACLAAAAAAQDQRRCPARIPGPRGSAVRSRLLVVPACIHRRKREPAGPEAVFDRRPTRGARGRKPQGGARSAGRHLTLLACLPIAPAASTLSTAGGNTALRGRTPENRYPWVDDPTQGTGWPRLALSRPVSCPPVPCTPGPARECGRAPRSSSVPFETKCPCCATSSSIHRGSLIHDTEPPPA